MNRITLVVIAVFCLCGPLVSAADATKPNIILILADDIGLPGFGCTGGIYKTPNIDALAVGGTRFDYCFSAPVCGPSRAMLLTGRYAFRTGVKDNGLGPAATPEKDGCVAQLMKQAGYATAVAGKWRQLSHLRTKEEGAKWGFDEFMIWGAGQLEEGESKAGKKIKKADGTKGKPGRYWDAEYNHNGRAVVGLKEKYGPDVLQDFVLDFARRHKDGPFFIYYPTPLIHSPIQPTPDSKSADGEKKKDKAKEKGKGKGNGLSERSEYAQNIAYLDKQIGQLAAELDKLGIRQNTLILFTGDNGSVPTGTVNGRVIDGSKHTLKEGGSRVPLIANWPGTTPAGVVSKDLTDFSDILPTCAALAGVSVPTVRKIDGHSLAPQLLGKSSQPREWAYVQLGENRYLRTERFKLTGDGELFDMKDAPYQQIPVPADSTDAEAKAARTRLQTVLDQMRQEDETKTTAKKRKKAKT